MASRGVNKVILLGHLGADPEIRYSAGGMAIAQLRVATTERVPAGEGNWEDRTEWHRVVVFGKRAESCGNYLNKGSQVYIEGRLQTRQWEDKEGAKRYTTEIVANDVLFVGRSSDQGGERGGPPPENRGGSSGGSYGRGGSSGKSRGGVEDLPPPSYRDEDDIPF